MGTRHLTAVYLDGEYKVAQYWQWDGYPEGAGITILHFLRDEMEEKSFKNALRNSTYISSDDHYKILRIFGMDDDGLMSLRDSNRMRKSFPEFSRDTGAEILYILQNHPNGLRLYDSITFAAESLFCEWAWVIDFEKRTFEAYEGFNEERELTPEDRFYLMKEHEKNGYHGVVLAYKWSLDDLPTDEDFLATFKFDEDEE